MEQRIDLRIPLNLIEIDGDKRQAIIHIGKAESFYRNLTKALCNDSEEIVYE